MAVFRDVGMAGQIGGRRIEAIVYGGQPLEQDVPESGEGSAWSLVGGAFHRRGRRPSRSKCQMMA
jgi:hypothetical protein